MEHRSYLNLPEWMLNPLPEEKIQKKTKSLQFLSRSMRDIQNVLAEGLRNEKYAATSGFAQKIDPRAKLMGTLILIVAAGLTHSMIALIILGCFSALVMALSHLPVWSLQKRIWGIIPLITMVAALPATLSFFNPGTPIAMLNSDPNGLRILGIQLSGPLYISKQGVNAALLIFLRVGDSLSFGSLLVLTTPVARLLRSLRSLCVPVLFVMTIEMSYRYIILLLTSSIEMFEARKMRTVGHLPSNLQRSMAGSSMAALFSRSMTLSEEVYQSMTARGYTGEAVSIQELEYSRFDFAVLAIIIGLALIIVLGGRVLDWQFIFS